MRQWNLFVAAILLVLAWPSLAIAQYAQQLASCNHQNDPTPQQQAKGCTAVLKSGRIKGLDLANVYNNRGQGHSDMGDAARALADYEKALSINPKHVNAMNGRGNVLVTMGQFEKALPLFDRAIKINPKNTLSYYNRGVAFSFSGQHDRAIEDYSTAIRLDPNYALAYGNRANAYLAKGDLKRAFADNGIALKLAPTDVLRFNRGLIHYENKDYANSIDEFTAAIKIDPSPRYLRFRSMAYEMNRQYELAIADDDRVIKLDPKDAAAWNGRCWSRAILGRDLEQALSDCEEALRLQPNTANIHDSRAFVFLKLGKIDKAIEDYDTALRIFGYVPGSPIDPILVGSLYFRGVAKTKKGDVLGGMTDMAAAKNADPKVGEKVELYGLK